MDEAVVHKQLETIEEVVSALTATSRALSELVSAARPTGSGQPLVDPDTLASKMAVIEQAGRVFVERGPRMTLYLDSRFVTPWEMGLSARARIMKQIAEAGARGDFDADAEKRMLAKTKELAQDFEWMASQMALFMRATYGIATLKERKFMRALTIEDGTATEWVQRIRGKHLRDAWPEAEPIGGGGATPVHSSQASSTAK